MEKISTVKIPTKLIYDPLNNISAVHFAAGSSTEITHRFKRDAIERGNLHREVLRTQGR
jgi:hypothetical protein